MYVYICIFMYVREHVCILYCIYIYIYAYIYVYMCIYMCVYVRMFVCICICLYMYEYLFNNDLIIFSRPTSFLQKSSCRVSSEKNILNSSVEWSRVEWKNWIKVISLFYFLTHFLFIINTVILCAHDN